MSAFIFFFYFIICLFSLVLYTTRAVEETLMGLLFQIYSFLFWKNHQRDLLYMEFIKKLEMLKCAGI